MKDIGEAITAVALLGIGLSIIINGFVIGGGKLPSQGYETCQNEAPSDCTLYFFVFLWVVAAIAVGSVYLALRIRDGTRRHKKGENLIRIHLTPPWDLVIALRAGLPKSN
jgi:hypothetical protein